MRRPSPALFPPALVAAALRLEYLHDPLGIEARQPRFSWTVRAAQSAARGAAQSGYQICVATRRARLSASRPDLWDSGVVASPATTQVAYAGAALRSRQRCFWRVRVRDQANRWSGWSRVARWTMGLLDRTDWSGDWIGTGESFEFRMSAQAIDQAAPPDNTLPDPWLRRTFIAPAKLRRATAFVASVGYHELYINGRKAGDAILSPSVTDHSQRARYVAYEIGPLLRAGENVLGLWLGTGWSIYEPFATADKPRAPLVLGQFDFEFADGTRLSLGTDDAWKTHPSPSTLLGVWHFKNFGGECYDARHEIAGWAEPGLDDRAWTPAKIFRPNLLLSADNVEPNRPLTPLRPVAIRRQRPGEDRADFGRNFSGRLEVDVRGHPGDTIEFLLSEREDQAVTYRMHSRYIVGPSGRGTFRNRFNYGTGRWLTIRGLQKKPAPGAVRGWLVRNDFKAASQFACGLPLFNRIHATARWTLENLCLGGYIVDCPHRERMGYGGDGHASLTTALHSFALGAFASKWAEDWRDVAGQRPIWGLNPSESRRGGRTPEPGNVPYTAPTYWGGGGPAWSGFCTHLPWEVYRFYGDRKILAFSFPTIGRWLDFLETKASKNLLRRWGGEWDFLGDWLWPDAPEAVNGGTRETLFFNNCYWIYNLQVAAEIALVLGEKKRAHAWRRRAAAVRRAVHAEFARDDGKGYVDNSQAGLAIALLAGVPPGRSRAVVWKLLEHEILVHRGGHIHAGITGGAMLFRLLLEARRDDLLYPMVRTEDAPGWGAMLRQGATTLWEAWRQRAHDSQLHSSFLFVGSWFIHSVVGIQLDPAHAGFRRFILRPGVLDQPELAWAKGRYDSERGRIALAWMQGAKTFELHAEIPANTTALVHLPTTDRAAVREGGRALREEAAIRIVGLDRGRLVLRVAAGRYRFTVARNRPPGLCS